MSNREAFLEEAVSLGDRLVQTAWWNQGRANWIAARRRLGPHGGGMAEALDPALHTGTAGVALFLARLHLYSADPAHRDTAEGALRHSLRHAWYTEPIASDPQALCTGGRWRFGFYVGTLGIAWTAHEVARLLGDPSLDVEAQRLLDRLRERRGPLEMDVTLGAAGGVCTLLDLDREGFRGARPLADQLATKLVKGALVRGDHWSWGAEAQDPSRKNATGYSHGAAGIAHALADYYAASGKEICREAAEGAFRYERAVYDPELENWPNFLLGTPDARGRYPAWTSWCHGAPGIGLARAASHGILKDDRLVEDARIALKTTDAKLRFAAETPGELGTLCCGTFGLLECAWAMHDHLGTGEGLAVARGGGRLGIERYGSEARKGSDGWIDWPTGAPRGAHPGLMQGYAGFGHFMLRLHDPARVPPLVLPAVPMKT